ncbi:uncharacterized protein N7483_003442 [Penicillium malachiteum]|uniref:uncharacterized protein n=1 Tax=Penicillium malachiteum TaxID=1324776 RepID=UPI0025481D9B|nr:uncharacterized protein N7483_003442 [Penicillium malachiteum]KAJ5728934.1 hypothetical protein N7483_003442 [Penicillium malachiteum]
MAHCLSCFRKRSDAGVDADVPPQPRRPNDKVDKVNESKIAPPANIVPLEINGTPRTKNDAQNDQIDDFDGQREKTPEQALGLGTASTTQSQSHIQSASQTDSQSHLDRRLKAETRAGSRNLWEVAEQRLDEQYKKWLNCEASQPIDKVIERIQSEAKENYKRLEKQELGARGEKRGSFDARAKFKNLLGFTLQAQDLIGAVVSFDATGNASTAWSIVLFGLTLLPKDIERHDLVVNASEYLAGVLSYHAIIDNNYRFEYSQANEGLEDALVEVYTATLKYAAEVEKAKRESHGRRFYNNITALVENPLEDLKASVGGMSDVVDRWKSLVRDEDQTKKTQEILNVLREEVIRDLKEISSRARNDEELQILEWLSAAQYSKPQNDKQKNRSSNTGKWILESEVYTDWKASPGEILWLRGAVGCGKSYLCSTIIHDIERYCDGAIFDALAYWYFDFSDEKTQYVENMEPRRERDSLLQFMEDLIRKPQEKLHLLATSRPEPDISEKLQKYIGFDLEASLEEDGDSDGLSFKSNGLKIVINEMILKGL